MPVAQSATLSGYVTDADPGESLLGATLSLQTEDGSITGTTTNAYGYYTLEAEAGDDRLTVRYVGSADRTVACRLMPDLRLDVQLAPSTAALQEVVVSTSAATQRTQHRDNDQGVG